MHLSVDAEKISGALLVDAHVPQPNAPVEFARSALLVGSRGVGKTFLLRHRKRTAHRDAFDINLHVAFSSLADEGIGARASELTAFQAKEVESKARALLATTLIEQIASRNAETQEGLLEALMDGAILPNRMREKLRPSDETAIQVRRAVERLDLRFWDNGRSSDLLNLLVEIADNLESGLTIFLDRGDDVCREATQSLMPLLSQSNPFLVVLATRPGAMQVIPDNAADKSTLLGDQVDVHHLGLHPYSEEWAEYLVESVRRFLTINDLNLPEYQDTRWLGRIARDSTRSAIQIFQGCANEVDRVRFLQNHQTMFLNTISESLRDYHDNFAAAIAAILKSTGPRGQLDRMEPVTIEISDMPSSASLLNNRQRFHDLLLTAMRSDALLLPEGVAWHPHRIGNRYEISPLAIWNEGIDLWKES